VPLVRIEKANCQTAMMNDFKKSESPILAMKSANNAVMTAAESVEQRGDTKGNVSTTNMRRTQRRESMSSGLARVRRLAKEQPKLHFTALMHRLTTDLLRQSYFWLAFTAEHFVRCRRGGR
jgi:RNA-directed DNA polymerase